MLLHFPRRLLLGMKVMTNLDSILKSRDITLPTKVLLVQRVHHVKCKTQHSKNQDYGIHSHHFMANGWGTMVTVRDFIFLGSKSTADGKCSHEIKRHLLLGIKAMTNLDSILKSRDITLPTKVCLVKAIIFPTVTYGCESWTIKKAEY